MLRASTSTGSKNGKAHLCCCRLWRVFKHGFRASEINYCFGGIFFCGCGGGGMGLETVEGFNLEGRG